MECLCSLGYICEVQILFRIKRLVFFNRSINTFAIAAFVCIALLSAAQQALAHHAMGGKTPSNFFGGFVSGLAHPVIGLDHLAFVVAIGLLSAGLVRGAFIPAGFGVAALAGTAIHLLTLDLPASEIAIAISVITFGAILVMPNRLNWLVLAVLAAIAGLFHGYAYGEAIVGAQMTPLVAYLLGFTLIQYVVALIAQALGNVIIAQTANKPLPLMRFAGFAITSIGVVFLTNSIVS